MVSPSSSTDNCCKAHDGTRVYSGGAESECPLRSNAGQEVTMLAGSEFSTRNGQCMTNHKVKLGSIVSETPHQSSKDMMN